MARATSARLDRHQTARSGLPEHRRAVSHYLGQCDEILPVSMGYKLKDQIAGARLIVLPNTMHSIQMERPKDCVRIIREFAAGPLATRSIPAASSLAAGTGSPAGK